MARRKARVPQGKKIQPAVLTMTFDIDSAPGAGTTTFVSLSQCASILNRRFYRAGLEWAVAGFTWFTQGSGSMLVSKIPDTWIAVNAWEKGFHHWNDLNDSALEASESIKPKFTDFKVYMDHDHAVKGKAANLLPRVVPNTDFKAGEWDMSTIIIPDSDSTSNEREIIWTGANYPGNGASGLNSVSLIEGYAASRGLPDIRDPNAPTDADDSFGATPQNWLSAITSEGVDQDEQVLESMLVDNIRAPYPFENDGTNTDTQYPGGANQGPGVQEHTIGFVTATTVGGVTQMPGGQFKGGLIKLQTVHEGASVLQIHLVPGSHRGYMARPLQDV